MAHGKGGRDGPEMAAAFWGGAEQEGRESAGADAGRLGPAPHTLLQAQLTREGGSCDRRGREGLFRSETPRSKSSGERPLVLPESE